MATTNYKKKILHVMQEDKFIPEFVDFIETHFESFAKCHLFFVRGDNKKHPIRTRENIVFSTNQGNNQYQIELIRAMYQSRKIILHGLFDMRLVRLLAIQPWLLSKCHWVIWGGDLYAWQEMPRNADWLASEALRRFVIKRIGHLITQIEGDATLAKSLYGAQGKYLDSFVYPSNLFAEQITKRAEPGLINIQIGNSADPSNLHIEMLDMLTAYKDRAIRVYAPLSYGNKDYATHVTSIGKNLLKEKFQPIMNFMAKDIYIDHLNRIDIALFNHKRQQGFGNIIKLLGLGKKVYLRRQVSTWDHLRKIGIKVFDIDDFDLTPLSEDDAKINIEIIRHQFSPPRLVSQLEGIFA